MFISIDNSAGESGAGKTEAARIVLQFLVVVSSDDFEVKLIKDRLVQANTLLEAFGNAKTRRNDNASRFVSYCGHKSQNPIQKFPYLYKGLIVLF